MLMCPMISTILFMLTQVFALEILHWDPTPSLILGLVAFVITWFLYTWAALRYERQRNEEKYPE